MNKLFIAMVAHEVNRAYCMSIGDASQAAWADAPDWQKDSAIKGVDALIANRDLTPEETHALWKADKESAGWVFGPIKDEKKKEHPCMVPYDQLPPAQRSKDYIFKAIVNTLADLPGNQIPGPQIPAPQIVVTKGMTPVKYIGRRPVYKEGAYGTGLIFNKDETLMVPSAKAILLLRHADVYVPGEVTASVVQTEPPATTSKPQESENETAELEAAHQAISTMNRAHMAKFAKANFNVDIDPEKPAPEVRAAVKVLIDRFGLPGMTQ